MVGLQFVEDKARLRFCITKLTQISFIYLLLLQKEHS